MVRTPTTAVTLVAAVALSLAAVAPAKPLERGTFHDEFTDVSTNHCGIPGLTVTSDFVVDGRFTVASHGPAGLAYYKEHLDFTQVDTNLANGKFVTVHQRNVDKDVKVSDNGDGTLTIVALATGNAVMYGMEGKAIARNPGQVRYELLIDHGGTPADPADDQLLDFLGIVKGSTGRSDDFCDASVAALR